MFKVFSWIEQKMDLLPGWGQTIAICFVLGVYSVVKLTQWAFDWMRYWGWVQ